MTVHVERKSVLDFRAICIDLCISLPACVVVKHLSCGLFSRDQVSFDKELKILSMLSGDVAKLVNSVY